PTNQKKVSPRAGFDIQKDKKIIIIEMALGLGLPTNNADGIAAIR
ncbi:TPA: hypothetical protein QCI68_004178, partial [Enterobacter asburiae]|nr:hypothetical protein [Enterobacter asburiae]